MGIHGVDGGTAVRRVNESLQGPVVDILARFVPELGKLPAGKAYERTLDDISLLQRCFEAFRNNRDQFRSVLVDSEQKPVTEDTATLSCGRTLEQVVAMIVRTAAKRYFRRKLAPPGHHHHLSATQALRDDTAKKGVVHRMTALFLEPARPRPAPEAKPVRSRADELYDALKQHLLHEWQVPLVPTYAQMSPTLARSLGDKLLEIRTPEDLRRVIDDPEEAAKLFDLTAEEAGACELAAASAGRRDERARLADVLTPDGRRLRVPAFAEAMLRPDVRAQLSPNTGSGVRLGDLLEGVGGLAAKLLVAELGLKVEQLAVFLLVAHETIGPDIFGRLFGQPGDAEMIMRVTQKARVAGLGQRSSLEECAHFVRQLFNRPNQSR
jgi:hypothetical protein